MPVRRLSTVLSTTRAFDPLVFIDDNKSLHGRMVNGIKVFAPEQLPVLIKDRSIDRVLLALPSLSRRRRREILSALEPLGVHVQTVPEFEQLVTGDATVGDIREVDVCDLLGRDSVPPKAGLFDACIRDRVVMVTGAGGSIGSELCRQIIGLGPKRLVLFEMSELALYNIERELRTMAEQNSLRVELVGLIGNGHHKVRMREIFLAYRVQTVYHAAAYKHVPIVEQNVVEGIYNNVIATWHTAEAAHETEVETFVLVSTDKAVNPTNVMGATKRFAEIVLQGLHHRGTKTRFCMVRFGNVLASSGSVVPLFNEQIKAGGPVTVTHPEVIRYFMTIPEAAQLVIQAGSMADGGDVFVLDMGKPVRICDLARRMIHLMGLTVRDDQHPDGDIEIAYTGLRPAEKLYEELLIGNNVTGTQHPMILRAIEHFLPWERVQTMLDELVAGMGRFDCQRSLQLLSEVVVEYKPAPESHDLVCRPTGRRAAGRPKGHQPEGPPRRAKHRADEHGADGHRTPVAQAPLAGQSLGRQRVERHYFGYRRGRLHRQPCRAATGRGRRAGHRLGQPREGLSAGGDRGRTGGRRCRRPCARLAAPGGARSRYGDALCRPHDRAGIRGAAAQVLRQQHLLDQESAAGLYRKPGAPFRLLIDGGRVRDAGGRLCGRGVANPSDQSPTAPPSS